MNCRITSISLCWSHRLSRRLGVITLLALTMTVTAGCDDGRPQRVPVSGQVFIDGKPLTSGFIRFTPDGARPASSEIDSDGRFRLMTFEPDDGAVIGAHAVSVTCVEQLSETTRRWNLPRKYADPRMSGLTVTIDGPTDSLRIELTWDGGKPFVETDDTGV